MKQWIDESGFCELVRTVCRKSEEQANAEKTASVLFNEAFAEMESFRNYKPFIQAESAYIQAENLLDRVIADVDAKEVLKKEIHQTKDTRSDFLKCIQVSGEGPFPDASSTADYLEQYYRLLKNLFFYMEILEAAEVTGQQIVQSILNADMYFNDTEAGASLYSPAVLDGIFHLYAAVEEYRRCTAQIKSALLKKKYQEILISKVLRYFRWVVVCDGELMQAAIPASLEETDDSSRLEELQWTLDVPIRPLRSYNSYEGIGELRLLDKVLYEIECKKDQKLLRSEFEITLVGDIQSRAMSVLCNTVCFALQKSSFKLPDPFRVHFRVLTYNESLPSAETVFSQKGITVTYEFEKYTGQLLQVTDLGKLLDLSDIVFILDSCDLYKRVRFSPMRDRNLFWQFLANDTYDTDYLIHGNGKNFERCGYFIRTLQILYTFVALGSPGEMYKKLNEPLLEYLRTRSAEKAIYVYISDLEAFRELDYAENQLIRIEQYNEKQIAILRMTDFKEAPLIKPAAPGSDAEKVIVFSFWQLVKHIAVRDIDGFLDFFGMSSDEDILTLQQTLAGVDYSRWPEELVFYYQVPDSPAQVGAEDFRKRVEECVRDVVMPFFVKRPPDMFYEYLIKSFGSFLYSDAKSVDDMLFLHLFENRHELLKAARLGGERKDLGNYMRQYCKYSQKQYYYEIMKDYDTSSYKFSFKYKKLEQLEKADAELRKVIFKNIATACQENSYKESFLYWKCAEA